MSTDTVIPACHEARVEMSRRKLLRAVAEAADVTFIRLPGNIGDHLIHAGTRQLLSGVNYKERCVFHLQGVRGHTAIVSGCGGWCGAYHDMPRYLPCIESRFERVVVFPSSFDVSIKSVRDALRNTSALVFAREEESYLQVKDLCAADIAHDCAFFFDFRPYIRAGHGVLEAFRLDGEAAGHDVPASNNDISVNCESLDEFLWTIARYKTVRTDRAHVMIAAAHLGKEVQYRASSYHKVPAIAEFGLKDFDLLRIDANVESVASTSGTPRLAQSALREDSMNETQLRRRTIVDIISTVGPLEPFILVDDEQFRSDLGSESTAVPFLERHNEYWGPPADDDAAITEFKRLYDRGLCFIIFSWPSFWWIDRYPAFIAYLESSFICLRRDERLVVFDLRLKKANEAISC